MRMKCFILSMICMLLVGCTADNTDNTAEKEDTTPVIESTSKMSIADNAEDMEDFTYSTKRSMPVQYTDIEYRLNNSNLDKISKEFSEAYFGVYGITTIPTYELMFDIQGLLNGGFDGSEDGKQLTDMYAVFNGNPIHTNFIQYQCDTYEQFKTAIDINMIGAYDIDQYADEVIEYAAGIGIEIDDIDNCYIGMPVIFSSEYSDAEYYFPVNYYDGNKTSLVGMLGFDGMIEIVGTEEYNNDNSIYTGEGTQNRYQIGYNKSENKFYIDESEYALGNMSVVLDPTYPLPVNIMYYM